MKGEESLSIKVRLHGRIRSAAGGSEEIELPTSVSTVGELLQELSRRLGSDASRHIFEAGTNQMHASLVLLVNGHSVKMLQGLKTPLAERDTVSIDSVDIIETVGGG